MKKLALHLLFIFIFLNHTTAQSIWQKILGGTFTDEVNAVLVTQDGHLLVGGSSESFSMDEREGYIAKLTVDGTLLWEQTYDFGSFWNPVYDMIELPNGHFLATGKTWAQICPQYGQSYIIEIDQTGDTVWTKGLCSDQFNLLTTSLASTPDGGYVFTGRGGYADIGLMKTDAFGNFEWETALVHPGWESGYNVIVTQDGNLVVCSYWSETTNGDNDAFLTKIATQTGDTIWTTIIANDGNEFISDVVETNDGSLVGVGRKNYFLQLYHFSPDGGLLEERLYLDSNGMYWFYPTAIKITTDGGYAIAGSYNDTIITNSQNGFLLKLDPNFDIEWYQTYGGDEDDQILDMTITPDGGYCLVGITKSFGDEKKDAWIIKTDGNGHTEVKSIKGKAHLDENTDCINDVPETGAPNIWVELAKGGESIFRLTDDNGDYSSIVSVGDYTLTASSPIPYWEFCNNPQQAQVTVNTSEIVRDFGLQAANDCPYITLDVSMPFLRLCSDGKIYGQICNNGTMPAIGSQVTIELDTFLILDSASIPYISQANNTFIFDTGNLDLFECKNFVFHVFTDCNAPFGWTHCLNASATPDTICHPDINPNPAIVQECLINVGSYDPNDKTAFPAGMGDEHIIENDIEIKYQVRFQNTGTDTAFKVVVIDTLSKHLDPLSFRAGANSHDYRLEWSEGNAFKFIFDPIILPDSIVNESASHGFVNFFIRPKPDLPNGTVIENSAAIYFDSNEPVITNRWFHTIGTPVFSADINIKEVTCPSDYPNPGTTLKWDIHIGNSGTGRSDPKDIYLFNGMFNFGTIPNHLYGSATIPALDAGETTTISIEVPSFAYMPEPGNAWFGEKSIFTGKKYLSFFPDGSTAEYSENDGFPNVYCKKLSTDIELKLSHITTTIGPNDPLVFEMEVTNNGPEDAFNIKSTLIDDHIPNGSSLPTFEADVSRGEVWLQNSLDDSTLWFHRYWLIPFLDAGESVKATVSITPPSGLPWSTDGVIINRSADSGHNVDTDHTNNTTELFICPKNVFETEATICAGETYLLGSQELMTTDIYTQNQPTANGCDSLIVLHLEVLPVDSTVLSAAICIDGGYTFENEVLTESGVYTHILQNQNGCDSILQLTLEVFPSDTMKLDSTNLCIGEPSSLTGNEFTTPGIFTEEVILQNQSGCDSLVVIQLEVLPVDSTTLSTTICMGDSYVFENEELFESGIYTHVLQNRNGCDSLIQLTLEVLSFDTTQLNHSEICIGEPSPLMGSYYETPGTFTEEVILQNQFGCDSLLIGSITVHPDEMIEVDTQVAFGTVYNNILLTQDTVLISVDTTAFGCILEIVENIIVGPTTTNDLNQLVGLDVYPNPVFDWLAINLELSEDHALDLVVYDVLGGQVAALAHEKWFSAGKYVLQFETQEWPEGPLILMVQSERKNAYWKLIKLN